MMKRSLQTCLILAVAAVVPPASAQESADRQRERMQWWHDAKFGLFIHWGVYAVPAGVYDGRQIDRPGEHIMGRAKIPVGEYKAFAAGFNPVRYDPEAWAALAQEAGMRYLVITSKHCEGFALLDRLTIEHAGENTIQCIPDNEGWHPVELRSLTLTRVD